MKVSKGRRGKVYKILGFALKIKRKDSQAVGRLENEARCLKLLNKHGIGPKLYLSGKNWILTKYIKGKEILDYFKYTPTNEKNQIIKEILSQCRTLDKLKINKYEMNHPQKHILIDKKPIMIDFERCKYSENPKNVTQFLQFIPKLKKIDRKKLIKLSKDYKKKQVEDDFKKILELFD